MGCVSRMGRDATSQDALALMRLSFLPPHSEPRLRFGVDSIDAVPTGNKNGLFVSNMPQV